MTLRKLLVELKTLRGNSIIAPFIKDYQVYGKSWTGEYDLPIHKDRITEDNKFLECKVLKTDLDDKHKVRIDIDYAPYSGKVEFYVKATKDWQDDNPEWMLNKYFQTYKAAFLYFYKYLHEYAAKGEEAPRVVLIRVDKITKEEHLILDSFDTDDDRR